MARGPKAPSIPDRVVERVRGILDDYLHDPTGTEISVPALRRSVPAEAADLADAVLTGCPVSYRDGVIIQTAFGLEGGLDPEGHTINPPGGRSVAQGIGVLFAKRHIAAVRDAYQNIGKNIRILTRGNYPAFDDLLRWLDRSSEAERGALLEYALAKVALTARNVLEMPVIERATLTFHRCAVFLDALLAIPSAGAYQQYAVAACLEAVIEEAGQGGVGGLRVETKRLNATDASSRVAGDVQLVRGNRVEEAFEVTANDWRTKVAQAVTSMRSADLQRIHIIAAVEPGFPAQAAELASADADVTVIDIAAFLQTLIAIMRKPARAAAFSRLYELLDRYQPNIERTNIYAQLLSEHGLALGNRKTSMRS